MKRLLNIVIRIDHKSAIKKTHNIKDNNQCKKLFLLFIWNWIKLLNGTINANNGIRNIEKMSIPSLFLVIKFFTQLRSHISVQFKYITHKFRIANIINQSIQPNIALYNREAPRNNEINHELRKVHKNI